MRWRFRGWGLLLLVCAVGCGRPAATPPEPTAPSAGMRPAEAAQVTAFCGGCHFSPEPDSFARRDWREEVAQGYRFHLDSGRSDLRAPPQEAVVAYYEGLAPERLPLDGPEQVTTRQQPSPLHFEELLNSATGATTAPAAARIERLAALGDRVLVSDMRGGRVWRSAGGGAPAEPVWRIPHPASTAAARLGPDATPGVVIADLGSFLPEDHTRGAVWWAPENGPQEAQPLISGLGRVSHVAVGDLDGDGDDDLVVSEFGWRRTGRLLVYWNDQPAGDWPHLREAVIDPRHGALRAEICDFDGDGRVDIVAAFAQEYESVESYQLAGERRFERHTLYRAPDPSWGSSDFEIVDLDRDGRLDVVVCHGDSFDGGDLRPYHGVRWLRQEAPRHVSVRQLVGMPGVHRAVPADLDDDGDLDLVAVALLPQSILQDPARPRLASVVWLEQQDEQAFVPHVLEWDRCHHAACAVLDEDGDGDLDVLVGQFHWQGDDRRLLTVYRNGLRPSAGR